MSSSAVSRATPTSREDPDTYRMMRAGTQQPPAPPRIPASTRSRARFVRRVDLVALERQLSEAFAALAANRPYPESGAPEVDRELHNQVRILRLMFMCGAQPAIDVSTTPWQSARDVVPTVVTIIGREAGCRDPSTVAACVQALCTAGLVRVARRMLIDPRRYERIESDLDVATGLTAVGGRLQRRGTLCLTPVGERLCRRCSAAERP
jgi:hypothetical protein